MKFTITKEIFDKFPDLTIGIIVAKGINNKGEEKEVLDLIKKQQQEIRNNFETRTLTENEEISTWRKAYSLFGAKPKKYRCSVENLYRMTLNDIDLTHINKIVDIYNYMSIKHMIPVGGDDINHIDGNISLTFAKGDESFTQLNTDETKSPKEGEVVYRDNKEILCRRWNWRECDKSKMTEDTKNVTLVVEGLPPFTKDKIKEIIEELNTLTKKYCGGETEMFILNKDNPEITI
jgi:DNA/RNA-binding domain of Phe-tRNA-synthetase-like protein